MGPGPAGIPQLEYIFSRIVCISVPLGFTALLVVLIVAGIKYLMSAGEPKAISQAHQTVTWGLLGVVFLAISWLILQLVQNLTGIEVTKFSLSSLPGVQGFQDSCFGETPIAPNVELPKSITSSKTTKSASGNQTSSTQVSNSYTKTCKDYPDYQVTYFDNCQEIELPYSKYKSTICWANCKVLKPYLENLQTYLDQFAADPAAKKHKEALEKVYSAWRSVLKDSAAEKIELYGLNYICGSGATGQKSSPLFYGADHWKTASSVGVPPSAGYEGVSKSAGFRFLLDIYTLEAISSVSYIGDVDKRELLGLSLWMKYPKGVIPLQSYEAGLINYIEVAYPPINYTETSNPTPSEFQAALGKVRRNAARADSLLGLACDDGNYYRADSLMPQKIK